MKKSNFLPCLFTIIFSSFLLLGNDLNAQRPIEIFEDTFKDMKTAFCCISVRARSDIRQIGAFDNSFYTTFLFYKEIKDGKSEIEMRMHITTGVLERVEKEIFLQTDNGRTKLFTQKTRDAFFKQEETTTPSDDDSVTEYLYYTQKQLEYTYLITDDLTKDFLKTGNILFRIYVDDVPFALEFTSPEVTQFKSFLLAK